MAFLEGPHGGLQGVGCLGTSVLEPCLGRPPYFDRFWHSMHFQLVVLKAVGLFSRTLEVFVQDFRRLLAWFSGSLALLSGL